MSPLSARSFVDVYLLNQSKSVNCVHRAPMVKPVGDPVRISRAWKSTTHFTVLHAAPVCRRARFAMTENGLDSHRRTHDDISHVSARVFAIIIIIIILRKTGERMSVLSWDLVALSFAMHSHYALRIPFRFEIFRNVHVRIARWEI